MFYYKPGRIFQIFAPQIQCRGWDLIQYQIKFRYDTILQLNEKHFPMQDNPSLQFSFEYYQVFNKGGHGQVSLEIGFIVFREQINFWALLCQAQAEYGNVLSCSSVHVSLEVPHQGCLVCRQKYHQVEYVRQQDKLGAHMVTIVYSTVL